MSSVAYKSIMKSEEERCWNILYSNAASINNEIKISFNDNINILKLVANAMIQEKRVSSYDAIIKHINAFQNMTIFSRIDILYPDNSVLLQTGEIRKLEQFSFKDIESKKEHMSSRVDDITNNSKIIYYAVPVVDKGKTQAILLGIIECSKMPELFQTRAYNGDAISCIIDYIDGNFIMDDWHKTMGNMYEMKHRKQLKGYEHVDLIADVKEAKTGVTAYKSAVNGENSYMYYTPVGIFNWELVIVVQEQVAFASLLQLRHIFFIIGLVEVILLFFYFIQTFCIVTQLERSKKEIEVKRNDLETLSYTDTLTMLYNRNKYNEVVEKLQKENIEKTGIAFFDLNGLKQINDEQGHKAGDLLIQNAASCISSVFQHCSFRIGGDEFIVIVQNIEEQDYLSMLNKVREKLNEVEINISIGHSWSEKNAPINELLKEADENMYQEKRSYYANKLNNKNYRRTF